MGRRLKISNYRVVVTPDTRWLPTNSDELACAKQLCAEIAESIRRRVYDVRHVEVEPDSEHVCEYCGRSWSEDSRGYNGGCCEADEAAEQARLAALGAA